MSKNPRTLILHTAVRVPSHISNLFFFFFVHPIQDLSLQRSCLFREQWQMLLSSCQSTHSVVSAWRVALVRCNSSFTFYSLWTAQWCFLAYRHMSQAAGTLLPFLHPDGGGAACFVLGTMLINCDVHTEAAGDPQQADNQQQSFRHLFCIHLVTSKHANIRHSPIAALITTTL